MKRAIALVQILVIAFCLFAVCYNLAPPAWAYIVTHEKWFTVGALSSLLVLVSWFDSSQKV